jgi:hypothetical protein
MSGMAANLLGKMAEIGGTKRRRDCSQAPLGLLRQIVTGVWWVVGPRNN